MRMKWATQRLRLIERMIEGHLIRLGNLRRERDDVREILSHRNDAEIAAKEEARQARNRNILRRHHEGATFAAIGREFGITGHRVKQICDKEERLERRRARHETNQGDQA